MTISINEIPASWSFARHYYEEFKTNSGNCDPRFYDELDRNACAGMEWPCLLFAVLCLNPSMGDYSPRKARHFIHTLIQEGHLESDLCLLEYLVIHEDDNLVARVVDMETLRMMADSGHTQSQHLLALFLFAGIGTDKDPEEALHLLILAADANNSEAQLVVAYRYLYGEGAPRDRATAFRYARKAEELGNDDAFWILW